MPSGSPSRRSQISPTIGRSGPGSQSGWTARARSTNRRVAASRSARSPSGSHAGAGPTANGRHRVLLLATDVERCAAGDDDFEPGEAREQLPRHRPGVQQMLEVVEHEQERPVGEERRQRVGGGPVDPVEQAEGPGDRGRDEGRVVRPSRATSQAPSAFCFAARASSIGEAGLADPAGSGQCHEPVVVEQPSNAARSAERPTNLVRRSGRLPSDDRATGPVGTRCVTRERRAGTSAPGTRMSLSACGPGRGRRRPPAAPIRRGPRGLDRTICPPWPTAASARRVDV